MRLLIIFFIFCVNAANAQFSLLKDINTTEGPGLGSAPHEFTIYHDSLFFIAHNGVELKLLKTDGSNFGTSVFNTPFSTVPQKPFVACGKLFFVGEETNYGLELFVYDGQNQPHRISDINPGSGSASIMFIGETAGKLYFRAYNGSEGRLYRTDGVQIELVQNYGFSFYSNYVGINWNNKLYFLGDSYPTQYDNNLLAFDSNSITTVATLGNEFIIKMFDLGSKFLFYTSTNQIYVSDGTSAGTQLIINSSTFSQIDNFIQVDSIVYFAGKTAAAGMNLWKCDGTTVGTTMLGDLNPGTADFMIEKLFELNHEIFIVGNFPGNGTTAKLFKHINPGSLQLVSNLTISSSSNNVDSIFIKNNNEMYFLVNEGSLGVDYQLWKSNGTSTGTFKVKNINYFNYGPMIHYAKSYHNKVYFNADDVNYGDELWVSDGTNAGTYMYYNFNGQSPSSPRHFTVANNQLYFVANTSTNANDLYVSDGTTIGTQLVKSLNGIGFPPAYDMAEINNMVVFGKSGGSGQRDAYVSDGTTLGTYSLGDLSTIFVQPLGFTKLNGYLFFVGALPNNATAIYKTDGTPIGTSLVATNVLDYNPVAITNEPFFVKSGNALFFNGKDDELWKIDGTTFQASLVKDIYPGISNLSDPKKMFSFNDKLYFSANDGISGNELWQSDGTNLGTTLIADLTPGNSGSEIYQIKEYDSLIFIACAENSTNGSLYKFNPATGFTTLVYHWLNAYPKQMYHANNKLIIVLNDLTNGDLLWVSQGDSSSTEFLKDTKIGAFNGDSPDIFLESNGFLYFTQKDANNQEQVWRSDATKCGTHKISNYSESTGNYILDMVDFNNHIYMDASSNGSSQEIWKYHFANPIYDTISQVLCQNTSIVWNGIVIQDTGQYCFSTINSVGIDSTVILHMELDTATLGLTSYSFPSSTNSCDGIFAIELTGNNPITMDFDGTITTVNGTNAILTNLCPGIHEISLQDSCGSVLTETIVVPVDTNYFFFNPFLDSVALDSLGLTNTNCFVDYYSIDTAFINSIWSNSNTIHVVWSILDTNGVYLDTTSYILNNGAGVYWVQLNIYCPNKSSSAYFTVAEAIYFSDSTSTLGLDVLDNLSEIKLFPNPANNIIKISTDLKFTNYTIFDYGGKICKTGDFPFDNLIDVTTLEQGVYFIQCESREVIKTLKFIKK